MAHQEDGKGVCLNTKFCDQTHFIWLAPPNRNLPECLLLDLYVSVSVRVSVAVPLSTPR